MFRKFAHSVLVLVLLLTTTGITYHYHYCGNTLMAFSILHTPKPCCEHPEDCCRDKAVNFQLKTDGLFQTVDTDLSVTEIVLPLISFSFVDIQPLSIAVPVFPEESPPDPVHVRLAWLQQFLI